METQLKKQPCVHRSKLTADLLRTQLHVC